MADNIIRVRKRKDINIGIIIFLVILVYVLFHVYTFFTKREIPLYEVQPGELYITSQCDGMILRDEKLVYTEIAGYLNYYFGEGSRIAKNSTVYSIDSNRDIYDLLAGSATEIKLSGDDLEDLKRLRDMAVAKGKFSVAVAAEIARGKAAGLYSEKVDLNGRFEIVWSES